LPALSFYFGIKYQQIQELHESIGSLNTYIESKTPPIVQENDENQRAVFFAWSYTTSEKDNIPYTTIRLTASSVGKEPVTKEIDTIEGGCNEYEDRDTDVYQNSIMIICYYAGLGRYYKVVEEDDGGYAVQRKVFEEGSPDYVPPEQNFETIARF
jgi:hypothetical protein